MTLSSYGVQTSGGEKNVWLLAIYRPVLGITRDDGKKRPGLYKLFNFAEVGTDIIDQKLGL